MLSLLINEKKLMYLMYTSGLLYVWKAKNIIQKLLKDFLEMFKAKP